MCQPDEFYISEAELERRIKIHRCSLAGVLEEEGFLYFSNMIPYAWSILFRCHYAIGFLMGDYEYYYAPSINPNPEAKDIDIHGAFSCLGLELSCLETLAQRDKTEDLCFRDDCVFFLRHAPIFDAARPSSRADCFEISTEAKARFREHCENTIVPWASMLAGLGVEKTKPIDEAELAAFCMDIERFYRVLRACMANCHALFSDLASVATPMGAPGILREIAKEYVAVFECAERDRVGQFYACRLI